MKTGIVRVVLVLILIAVSLGLTMCGGDRSSGGVFSRSVSGDDDTEFDPPPSDDDATADDTAGDDTADDDSDDDDTAGGDDTADDDTAGDDTADDDAVSYCDDWDVVVDGTLTGGKATEPVILAFNVDGTDLLAWFVPSSGSPPYVALSGALTADDAGSVEGTYDTTEQFQIACGELTMAIKIDFTVATNAINSIAYVYCGNVNPGLEMFTVTIGGPIICGSFTD